jgi:hypothetical protein
MRMTRRPGEITHHGGVRELCPTCNGPRATHAPKTSEHSFITICPVCDKRPELAVMVSRLPTESFLDHQKVCSTCHGFPVVMCQAGRKRLADVPGFWSET